MRSRARDWFASPASDPMLANGEVRNFACSKAAGRERQLGVNMQRNSAVLCSAAPIVARTNDRNFTHSPHIEKIAVDADQQRPLAGNGGAEYRHVCGIAAQAWR